MNMKKTPVLIALMILAVCIAPSLFAQTTSTERVYLSGRGADDMVEWDFFCSDGRNAGEWSKIGVPSCWELQGFGKFQYGIRYYGIAFPDAIAKEKGIYRYEFEAPKSWRGRQAVLVFEAAMTDTDVRINGRRPGTLHQGGFYRFSFDITDFLKYGQKNQLEVTVIKESENAGVNLAERRADYWNFGGIIRPVFVELRPAINIAKVAVDGQSDGAFRASVALNRAGDGLKLRTEIMDADSKVIASSENSFRTSGDAVSTSLQVNNPLQWTAETPHLYTVRFSLLNKSGRLIHQEEERFGFRSIEVRESDGLYINGEKVLIKGVNRHSFRPESGRTLSKAMNIEDVLLIKSMNMNAVRLSHYPADPEFLQACDSLGLYVINELAGWHGKYDTPTGAKLIKSMVERDRNHPSVIWWANGNEKGWNTELDGEFHQHDLQKRPVLHPQGNFGGFETMHYRSYGESQEYMRKPEIFMPTEFLHGLYDGGHGAGLFDYWEMMRNHPRCAGGFLWVLADEGVMRVDMDSIIDNQGNYGADGIVGPHHEKEGSYYSIREIWNPVQVMNKSIDRSFDGRILLENRYDFLNLNTCTFHWKEVKFPDAFSCSTDENPTTHILRSGKINGPDIAAGLSGVLNVPITPSADADALFLSVCDYRGEELWRWSFPFSTKSDFNTNTHEGSAPLYQHNESELVVKAADKSFYFSQESGMLIKVMKGEQTISFGNGPSFVAAKRADRSMDQFYNHDDEQAQAKNRTYTSFTDAGQFTGFEIKELDKQLQVKALYRLGNMEEACWTFASDGSVQLDFSYRFSAVVDLMGIAFDYPEEKVLSKRWLGAGPFRVWQNRLQGPVYDLWENDYNDPIPGESFTYPEFKGYFAQVSWMNLVTEEGTISIGNHCRDNYVGVYEPRDGRDQLLYTLPKTGISLLQVIPPVRNKVNATDLIGPSSQPKWVDGLHRGSLTLQFN